MNDTVTASGHPARPLSNRALEQKLSQAIKALNIYDDCMTELSFYVGHMRGRCTDACHDQAIAVCAKAMTAQKILHKLDPTS